MPRPFHNDVDAQFVWDKGEIIDLILVNGNDGSERGLSSLLWLFIVIELEIHCIASPDFWFGIIEPVVENHIPHLFGFLMPEYNDIIIGM